MEARMPSISNFANMYRYKTVPYDKTLSYAIKPKLHGTNGSILITNDKFQCRSKNRILGAESDHMDFAKTMTAMYEEWMEYREGIWGNNDIVVYGEWAGPGVQKTDAVSKIPQKTFFVFAVYEMNERSQAVWTTNLGINDGYIGSDRVYEIPVIREETVNFNEHAEIDSFVEIINEETKKFEERDSFIYDVFGVDEAGEGIVGTPTWSPTHTHWAEYTFKAKTEAHRVKKTKQPASAKDPIPQEAFEFGKTYVTEARIRQCMSELGIETPTMKDTPAVLNWMHTDIIKESMDDVADMGIDYSGMKKIINNMIVSMWKGFANGDLM